jgi:hypothetical protein
MVKPTGRDLRKELKQTVQGAFHDKDQASSISLMDKPLRSDLLIKKQPVVAGMWKHDLCPN